MGLASSQKAMTFIGKFSTGYRFAADAKRLFELPGNDCNQGAKGCRRKLFVIPLNSNTSKSPNPAPQAYPQLFPLRLLFRNTAVRTRAFPEGTVLVPSQPKAPRRAEGA